MIMLYDTLVVIALMMLATLVVMFFYPERLTAGKDLIYTIYLLGVWTFYLDRCWKSGMTLGMLAWKVKLISVNGENMSMNQRLVRFLGSLLSAICVFLGYIWILLDREKRSWHDMLSGTRLVSNRAAKNQDGTQ